jgi:hypothetical protein
MAERMRRHQHMRRTITRLAAVAVGTALLTGTLAGTAFAEGTPVAVELSPSTTGLTISQPSTAVTLRGGAAPGTTLTGSLGDTTVTDARGTLLGWTVTATTTDDLVSTTNASHRISLGTTGAAGPLTVGVPSVTAVVGSLLAGVAPGVGGSLNPTTPVVIATALTGLGGGTYSFNPSVELKVPANTYAETYRTVVVQTIA